MEKMMWEIMKHLGKGEFRKEDDGTLVFESEGSLYKDEVIFLQDRLVWTRAWKNGKYDGWVFYEDDIRYVGNVVKEGFRSPPVMFEWVMP